MALRILLLALVVAVVGCGGSGGGGDPRSQSMTPGIASSASETPPPQEPPPADDASGTAAAADKTTTAPDDVPRSSEQASRLLAQASLGAGPDDIERLRRMGYSTWLDRQMRLRPTYHTPRAERLLRQLERAGREEEFALTNRYIWWDVSMRARDQLRQRVAYALSQIFVVSDTVEELFVDPIALSSYYDVLVRHAFGNFEELLLDVTLHPVMGEYLDHLNNPRARPEENTFPDENYAREVMQLFTIGLYELNPDGSRKLDAEGRPIPTYSNVDIREFAKVFTGLSFADSADEPGFFFNDYEPVYDAPMQMFEEWHEPGEKRLLNGTVLPPGQPGLTDIRMAVNNLYTHPNVGPFIARRLIQRLVTSNPTPEYIARVSAVFADNGTGERGDLGAVVRAILTDAEAIDPARVDDPAHGRLQEPVLRYLRVIKALEASSDSRRFYAEGFYIQDTLRQHPLSSPSVFNFFTPDYQPNGPVSDAGLVAPEFQLVNSATTIDMVNFMLAVIVEGFVMDLPERYDPVYLSFESAAPLMDDLDALLDHFDIVLTAGELRADTRALIRSALAPIDDDPEFRMRLAAYLVAISPDAAVAH